ncbi:MAG: YibE/F family protein [Fusobacteriaceae bacterium]
MREKLLPFFVIFSIVAMVIFAPKYGNQFRRPSTFKQNFVTGKVIEIVEENLMKDPIMESKYRGSQSLKVLILDGVEKGKIYSVHNSLGSLHNVYAKVGEKAIFTVRETDKGKVVWLYNEKRDTKLYILGAIFLMMVIFLGKMKGVKSLISLIFTGVMIVYALIPLLFTGMNPILSSVSIISLIAIVSFLLIGGFSKKTYSAIIGTIFGISLAGGISYYFGEIMNLSGINMTGGEQLIYVAKDYRVQIKGLLFVAILIASLGAVMDVAMSIASSANELYENNKDIENKQLFISVMNIGKDIMGTMVNTLILAFTGSSLPMIMMIWGYNMNYNQFINIPAIAIEVMNALAGSIGIISTVPFTALVSIILINKKRGEKNE